MSTPTSLAALLDDAVTVLRTAGLAAPAFEARALVSGVLGLGPEEMLAHPDRTIYATARSRLADGIARRARGEPLARITGQREFWSLSIAVGPDTLIPRPDSETVVESVLALIDDRDREMTILDLGTGTGCLLFALLVELPNAHGIGVDRAAGAVAVARDNGRRLGLSDRAEFRIGDWAEGLAGPFDVVVCNPPYVAEEEFAVLAPEVREFEPQLALDGGPDGLAAYRALLPGMARVIAPYGFGVLELGAGQHDQVGEMCRNLGLFTGSAGLDLTGRRRALPVAPRRGVLETVNEKKKVGKSGIPV